jgi:hypothetical protein
LKEASEAISERDEKVLVLFRMQRGAIFLFSLLLATMQFGVLTGHSAKLTMQ